MLIGQNTDNLIINGAFDYWQRGTSLSAATGVRFLADRFYSAGVGSTVAPSRQSFPVGHSEIPGSPNYYHRCVVSSVAGAGNYASLTQRVESLSRTSGDYFTLDFWARADAAKPMSVELYQHFGTGGSPSSQVYIAPAKMNLTTTWQRYTSSFYSPSILGKVIGSSLNDSLYCNFWFDAGSSLDGRTQSLGQRSGTFDIANVQIVRGQVVGDFQRAGGNIFNELLLCQRYFETNFPAGITPATNIGRLGGQGLGTIIAASTNHQYVIPFVAKKRTTGYAVTVYNPSAANGNIRNSNANTDFSSVAFVGQASNEYKVTIQGTSPVGSSNGQSAEAYWTVDAEF